MNGLILWNGSRLWAEMVCPVTLVLPVNMFTGRMVMYKEIHKSDNYPKDGQHVLYYFEPFDRWYVGIFDEESMSVGGRHGWTTWHHEVLYWMDGEGVV